MFYHRCLLIPTGLSARHLPLRMFVSWTTPKQDLASQGSSEPPGLRKVAQLSPRCLPLLSPSASEMMAPGHVINLDTRAVAASWMQAQPLTLVAGEWLAGQFVLWFKVWEAMKFLTNPWRR